MFPEIHTAEKNYGKPKIEFRKKFIWRMKIGSHKIPDTTSITNQLIRSKEIRPRTLMMFVFEGKINYPITNRLLINIPRI